MSKVSKEQIQRLKKKRCPLCKGELRVYKDYSGNRWLGCIKCEEWEVALD